MFFVQSFFCSPCFSRFWSIKFNYQIQKLKRNYLNVIFWKVLIKRKLSLLLLASSKMKSWVTVYPTFRIFVYFSRLSSFNRYIYAGDISVYSHYRGRKLSKARILASKLSSRFTCYYFKMFNKNLKRTLVVFIFESFLWLATCCWFNVYLWFIQYFEYLSKAYT